MRAIYGLGETLFPCYSNQISSLMTGDGAGDWSSMRDTLTNVFLGDNDLTELPKERSKNGNGDNKHHNWNGNGGRTEADNGSGASLAECRKLTWLNLDNNKVHIQGVYKSSIILVLTPQSPNAVSSPG
jgi:Leucine-rich repeat (LRR) protein